MRYIYIAGLEHSGTTVLGHLLGRSGRVLGLGEVGQFFSPRHMKNYMAAWGAYPDVRLCSCGEDWEDCEFWGGVYHLSGLCSDAPLEDKYDELLGYCAAHHQYGSVFVDSSKSIEYLERVSAVMDRNGHSDSRISVLWNVKDVRNFASSINRKVGNRSLIRTMRTFNWWLGANRRMSGHLERAGINYKTTLYEKLCLDPETTLSGIFRNIEVEGDVERNETESRSHIILGNKDFVSRNREKLRYDARWFLDGKANLAYMLHWPARRMNESLYEAAE